MRHRHVVALLALGSTLVAGCAAAVPPREAPPRTIGVTGTGRVSVKPDVALVRIGVDTRAPVLADATAETARRMAAVLAGVKALVPDRDVATVTYDIEPLAAERKDYQEPPRVIGYRVGNVVRLRIRDLDAVAVGRILDAAVAAGANVLHGLRFTLDDPSRARAEARALAVADAAVIARQLADAAGASLGALVSLTEGVAPRPGGGPMDYEEAPARAPGQIEPGELEVVITVTAHYLIAR
jgi:uncharacterized protein YggE